MGSGTVIRTIILDVIKIIKDVDNTLKLNFVAIQAMTKEQIEKTAMTLRNTCCGKVNANPGERRLRLAICLVNSVRNGENMKKGGRERKERGDAVAR